MNQEQRDLREWIYVTTMLRKNCLKQDWGASSNFDNLKSAISFASYSLFKEMSENTGL
jgi:hypothetical protein